MFDTRDVDGCIVRTESVEDIFLEGHIRDIGADKPRIWKTCPRQSHLSIAKVDIYYQEMLGEKLSPWIPGARTLHPKLVLASACFGRRTTSSFKR